MVSNPLPLPPRSEVLRIPLETGPAGTKKTLEVMAEAARQGAVSPIVEAFASAFMGLSDVVSPVVYLERWFRLYWRITEDPFDVEYILTPERQLQEFQQNGSMAGDCDDAAVLAGALLLAMGLPAQFIAVRVSGPEFSHVWTMTGSGDDVFHIDPVVRKELVPVPGVEYMVQPV